jgi:hypothetical protein
MRDETNLRFCLGIIITPGHLRKCLGIYENAGITILPLTYIHGAELDSDSLGLLPIPDYDQSDLRSVLNQSRDYVEMRIQEQEEELRARNAQVQAVLQKKLSKGPRDRSPRED